MKRIDAVVLYEYLYSVALEGSPGEIGATSFENIAERLNEYGLRTARDARWTAATVRANLAILENVGVAIRVPIARAEFNLTVARYAGTPSAAPVQRQATAAKRANEKIPVRVPVRFQNENENENENRNENEFQNSNSSSVELINISRINKLINKQFEIETETETAEETAPTVDDAVRNVDFSDDKIRRLRQTISREVYEPGLHADLIDRATAAIVQKFATIPELKAAIRSAKEERRLQDVSNGFRGKPTIWRTFALFVKSWFDDAGFRWTPTANRREKSPFRVETEEQREARILAAAANAGR